MVPTEDTGSPAPIDRPILEWMRSRFVETRTFGSAEIVTDGNVHLRADLSAEYFPHDRDARLEIRWYRNDDFSIHYVEQGADAWQCRWDRHPNSHNARAHFHPPPDASQSDAEDAQWPTDHRDVTRLVLDRLEARIDTLWEQR